MGGRRLSMSIHVSPTAADAEAFPAHVGERAAKAPGRRHASLLTGLVATALSLGIVSVVINVYGLRWPEGIGGSMWGQKAGQQTIRDGQHVLYMKPWRDLRKGDIVLVLIGDPPYEGVLTAKRINKFDAQGRLWLHGDNRAESFDSESYGYVERSRVIGLCLVRLPRCFDGPGEEAVDGKGVLPVDSAMKLKKSSSPPAVYSSGFPNVYAWLLSKKQVFHLQFTVNEKLANYFVPTEGGKTALIYYFGQRTELEIGDRRIIVPQTDQVTALVIDVSKSDKIRFTTVGSGFTYFRLWVYNVQVHPAKSR